MLTVKFLDRLHPDVLFFLGKHNRLLMDTLDLLACYLLKRAGNHSLGEDVAQNIRIIDILCALPNTEYGDLLRQM